MQSAQRMLEFTKLKTEKVQNKPKNSMDWPQNGAISFKHIVLKYLSEGDVVLKGISFDIPAQYKIAIVGKSGAGKSSIVQALFRLVEIEELPTSKILIDGVNICNIDVKFLRQNLTIIP